MSTDRAAEADAAVRIPVPVRVWLDQADGWYPWVPGGGPAVDLRDGLPAHEGQAWVVVEDAAGFRAAGAALGAEQRTAEALRRHLPDGGERRARVHRGTQDDVILTLPAVSFVGETREVETGWITLWLHGSVAVTLEEGGAGVLATAAARLEYDDHRVTGRHHPVVEWVLHTLIDVASDVEDDIADAVTAVEREVFSAAPANDVAEQVYDLKREIAEARRAVAPVGTALPELVDLLSDTQAQDARPAWLGRVQTVVDRIDQHLDQSDALLSDMLNVHLSQVSVQQNEDMRRISAWAAIIAVPTFIAGVYGMNVQNIPGLTWRYGFLLTASLMALSALILWFIFRRSGWWGPPRPRSLRHRRRSPGAPHKS